MTPPLPCLNNVKKTALFLRDGFPKQVFSVTFFRGASKTLFSQLHWTTCLLAVIVYM